MQSTEDFQATSGSGISSAVPIQFLELANAHNRHENSDQKSPGSVDLVSDLSKVTTQTTLVKCKGQEVKIHAVQTGMVAVKRSHLTDRTAHFLTPIKISLDRRFTQFLPIWVWVIEHPEGVIVIDTGENAEVVNSDYFAPAGKLVAAYSKRNLKFNINKENEIGFQLHQLGIAQESIKNVVLTHLHLDHTDGIKDFPNVEILISDAEYKHPSGHLPQLLPSWFNPKRVTYKKDMISVFNKAYPITDAEDVLLVPTGGHTKHHASVLFKTDSFDILFAGDVSYTQEQLLQGDIAGINANYKESKRTYDTIKTYAKHQKLIFLPSHDLNATNRLINRIFLC